MKLSKVIKNKVNIALAPNAGYWGQILISIIQSYPEIVVRYFHGDHENSGSHIEALNWVLEDQKNRVMFNKIKVDLPIKEWQVLIYKDRTSKKIEAVMKKSNFFIRNWGEEEKNQFFFSKKEAEQYLKKLGLVFQKEDYTGAIMYK